MIDDALLENQIDQVLVDAAIPELPLHYHGKVRDSYDLPNGERIIIASDRLSAFDRNIVAIPFKGQILTQLARFWFDITKNLCPNHVISYPDPNVLLGRRVNIIPVEIIVRDYLTGSTATSIWPMYEAGHRNIYGLSFPEDLRKNQKLPKTIITPTTKAYDGAHDEPLTVNEIVGRGLMEKTQWDEVTEKAFALFEKGKAIAAERGLILVDTKYEFGVDQSGKVLVADEIHTPDSSRFWEAETYEERMSQGQAPDSFDKDYIRSWVRAACDPYREDIPKIPRKIIVETAKIYIRVYERITGQEFKPADTTLPVLERIRKALRPYFSVRQVA